MNFGILSILTLALAAAASAGLIVLLRPVLERYALARPNARSSHKVPTPQGAGLAVIAATLCIAGLALFGTLELPAEVAAQLGTVFAAAVVIAAVGTIDDIRPIPIVPRLFLQALAVGMVLNALPGDIRVTSFLPLSAERVLLLLAGIWFVNLVNFMDGIDWITVAEVVPVATGLALIGLLGGLPDYGVVCALALGGAMIGFAPFNRPMARLFLGDVGSLPIGLLLGWLLVLVATRGHAAAALILPLYYLADATITLLRRIARRESFWEGHRFHFYQQASDGGFRAIEVVARVFAVNLVLVALAVVTVMAPGPAVSVAALVCATALVGTLLWMFARGKR